MPTFGGATEWVESDPLGPAELRGHVVLVNFWTLTCINWLPQEPYVRAWSQAYRDDSAPKEENLMSRTQQAHGEEGGKPSRAADGAGSTSGPSLAAVPTPWA
jgi:hypothetical protein